MKNKTFKERLEAGLARDGFARVQHQTRKYSVWRSPNMADAVFVGKNGALRVGRSVTDSRSICDAAHYTWCSQTGKGSSGYKVYKRLLELGDGQEVMKV